LKNVFGSSEMTARAFPVAASASMTRKTWWPRWLYSNVTARLSLRHWKLDRPYGFGKRALSTVSCALAATSKITGLRHGERVARLRVDVGRVFRLQLIGGGRLDVVHLPAVAGPDAVRRDLLRVRRPRDRPELVGVAFRAVGAERDLSFFVAASRTVML
jgi:hypothetical protein